MKSKSPGSTSTRLYLSFGSENSMVRIPDEVRRVVFLVGYFDYQHVP
jgi:hypothetical protein